MERIPMGNERLHYRSPNINVCFKSTITGAFTNDQFHDAIEAVCRRHILLTCVLQTDDNNNIWYLPNHTKPSLEIYDNNNLKWHEWYEREDGKPFDFTTGPLAKFCVFRKNDKIDIVILGHHVIGDGIGYLNLLRDFLYALDGELDATPIKYIANNTIKDRTGLGFISTIYAKCLNRSWRSTSKQFTEREYLDFFTTYRKANNPCMYLGVLDSSRLDRIISKCKGISITVNEAISAAFTSALLDSGYNNIDKVKLGVAANIRNEMLTPSPDAMGNCTTGIKTLVHWDKAKSFADNARTVKKALRQQLNVPKYRYQVIQFLNLLDKAFLDAVPFAAYGDFNNLHAKKLAMILGETTDNKGIGVSNLGKQDIAMFANLSVEEVLFIPPAFPANLINIGIITTNNRIRFCIRYSQTDIPDHVVESIYMKAIQLLTE